MVHDGADSDQQEDEEEEDKDAQIANSQLKLYNVLIGIKSRSSIN